MILLSLLLLFTSNITGQSTSLHSEILAARSDKLATQAVTAHVAQSAFTPSPEFFSTSGTQAYPTASSNNAAITAIFGSGGIDIDTTLLTYIQNFYFYLDYFTRLQKAAVLLLLAQRYQIPYKTIILQGGWTALIKEVSGNLPKDAGGSWDLFVQLATLEQYMAHLDPQKSINGSTIQGINTLLTNFYTSWSSDLSWKKNLITSTLSDSKEILSAINQAINIASISFLSAIDDVWSNSLPEALYATFAQQKIPTLNYWNQISSTSLFTDIMITADDLTNCLFWQDWNKYLILQSLKMDEQLLQARYASEAQLFSFMPYMETAYYMATVEENRYSSELTQLNLLLNDHIRTYAQKNIPGWQTLNGSQVIANIDKFSLSAFYKQLEKLLDLVPQFIQNSQGTASHKISPPTLTGHHLQEFILFNMINTITSQFQVYLEPSTTSTSTNLTKTMTALSNSTTRPTPWLFPYDIQEALYLEELNEVRSTLSAIAKESEVLQAQIPSNRVAVAHKMASASLSSSTPTPTIKPQGWNSFIASLTAGWDNFWHTVATGIMDAIAAVVDIWHIISNGIEEIYYDSGLARLCDPYLTPAQQHSQAVAYNSALNQDWVSFGNDVKGVVSAFVTVSMESTFVVPIVQATLTGLGAILNDPSLSLDFNDMLEDIADAIGTAEAGMVMLVGEGVQRLTDDAIIILTDATVSISTGNLGNDWKLLASDIVSTFLQSIVIVVGTLQSVLGDIIKAVGYLIKTLASIIIDVGSGIAALTEQLTQDASGNFTNNLASYYAKSETIMNQHRRLISQIVTSGLMIGMAVATTIGTFGAGTPAAMALVGAAVNIIMTITFSTLNIISGVDQDDAAMSQQAYLTGYLTALTSWTANQSLISQYMQNAISQELAHELNAEVTNHELQLGFYQNYFNSSYNQIMGQYAQSLASYQAPLLQPVAPTNPPSYNQNIAVGDVGSSYGYATTNIMTPDKVYGYSSNHNATGWLNLNPSQGFVIYKPYENQFCQEIAQAVSTFVGNDNNQISRFWFLQSLTKDAPASTNSFAIRFQPIYLLDQFYIGIGIGGQPLNQANIVEQQQANIDRYHLATMIVLSPTQEATSTNTSASPNVYKHETAIQESLNGWLSISPRPSNITIIPGAWYTMTATIANDQLTFTITQESDKTNTTNGTVSIVEPASTSAAPGQPVPLTVIYSGASMAFQIVSPQENYISVNYPANLHGPTPAVLPGFTIEAQREVSAVSAYHALLNPTVGSYKLTAYSPAEILKGHYVYTLANTDSNSNDILSTDYVILGAQGQSQNGQNIITTINMAPTAANLKNSPVLISLITGKVYNTQLPYQSTIWQQMQKPPIVQPGSMLSPTLVTTINNARSSYANLINKPINNVRLNNMAPNNTITLMPTSLADITAGQYIYSTKIIQPTKNGFTKPLQDFVICAYLDTQGDILDYGMPYDAQVNGLISLVTYWIYPLSDSLSKSSVNPTIMSSYIATYGQLRPQLISNIRAAVQKYTIAEAPPVTPINPPAPHTISPPPPPPAKKCTGFFCGALSWPRFNLNTQQHGAGRWPRTR